MLVKMSRNWNGIVEGIRNSLWFVPGLMTILAAVLAFLTIELDFRVDDMPALARIVLAFGGGAEGARGVLDAIAGTMMTVTGVVFSLTLIALQLASSQFSPHVLRSFSRDRVPQYVMGMLIGTFTYSLIVLRSVRATDTDGGEFIPRISVYIAIALALISIGFLIFYIHHVAQSIRATTIVDRVTHDANMVVERLFPHGVGQPAEEPGVTPVPPGEPALVRAKQAGYLQSVEDEPLFQFATERNVVIRMEAGIGDFLVPGAVLASIWPGDALEEDIERAILEGFVLGPDRTLQQDVEYSIRELADIAIRALSPSINDPSTARICLDRLGEVLVNLGNREPPARVRRDDSGKVRVIARRMSYERAVELSFDEILRYGIQSTGVIVHLVGTLGRVAEHVPLALRPLLEAQVEAVQRASREKVSHKGDAEPIERAAQEVLMAMHSRLPHLPGEESGVERAA
jgi:uncharacterized membrane protein